MKSSLEYSGKATVNIPIKLPSLNEYVSACRANKYAGGKLKKDTERAIMWFINRVPAFTSPVFIHFHWIEPSIRRDCDNVAFAKKFILDALVSGGCLQDDSPRYVVGFRDTFEYKAGKQGVRVTIEPLGE